MTQQVVDSKVVEALVAAGVPPRDIELGALNEANIKPSGDGAAKPNISRTVKVDPVTKKEIVSGSEPDLSQTVPPAIPPTDEKPLTKTEVAKLLQDAVDGIGRKVQGTVDKRVGKLETQFRTILTSFQRSSEEAEMANLSPEERTEKRLAKLEKERSTGQVSTPDNTGQFPAVILDQMTGFVEDCELKVDDPRLDWATDEADPKVGFERLRKSVAKALKADRTKAITEATDKSTKEVAALRKKYNLDKVSTSGASGGSLDVSKLTPGEKIELGLRRNSEK